MSVTYQKLVSEGITYLKLMDNYFYVTQIEKKDGSIELSENVAVGVRYNFDKEPRFIPGIITITLVNKHTREPLKISGTQASVDAMLAFFIY